MEWNGMEWNGIKTFLSKIKNILYTRSLHPFLLCFFIVLYYYNEVEAMCSIVQPVVSIIALLFCMGLSFKLSIHLNWNILTYHIVITFWTSIFFFSIFLSKLILPVAFEASENPLIRSFICLVLLSVLLTVFFLKKNNHVISSKINQYLNFLFLIFTCVELTKTVFFLEKRQPYIKDFQTERSESSSNYNLFILIIDGYARSDNLKRYWNYDNQAFLNFLKQKNFFLVEKSRSNYRLSDQTLCSILSLNYLSNSKNPLYKSRQTFENPLFRLALQQKYACYNLGLFPISKVENNYIVDDFTVKNLYHYIALHTPLFGYYNSFNKQAAKNRSKTDIDIYSSLSTIFSQGSKKKLVLSHSAITHAPYDKIDSVYFCKLFESKYAFDTLTWDQYKSQEIPNNAALCRNCYLNQLKISNCLMSQTLDKNWENIKANSVIVIMSDHGFRFLDKKVFLHSSNKEAYENFAAIYFPDKDYATLNDSMTILNSVRMSVNKALNTRFNYIIDKSNME